MHCVWIAEEGVKRCVRAADLDLVTLLSPGRYLDHLTAEPRRPPLPSRWPRELTASERPACTKEERKRAATTERESEIVTSLGKHEHDGRRPRKTGELNFNFAKLFLADQLEHCS